MNINEYYKKIGILKESDNSYYTFTISEYSQNGDAPFIGEYSMMDVSPHIDQILTNPNITKIIIDVNKVER